MVHFGIHDLRKLPQQLPEINLAGATINNNLEIPNPLPVEITTQNAPIEVIAPDGNPLSVAIDGSVELKPFGETNFTPFFVSGSADQSILPGAAYGRIIHHVNIGIEDYIEVLENGQVIAKLYQDGIYDIHAKTDFAQQKEWRAGTYTIRANGNIYSIDLKYPKS